MPSGIWTTLRHGQSCRAKGATARPVGTAGPARPERSTFRAGRGRRNGRGTNRRHPLLFLGTVAERGHAGWNTTLISALRRRWQPVGDEGLSSRSSEKAQSMTLNPFGSFTSRMRKSKMRAKILNIIRERDDDHRNVRVWRKVFP
jgi:hypothetical protein